MKEKVLNAWKEVIRARIVKKGDIKHWQLVDWLTSKQ